jgi:cold shock protein
MPSVSLLAKRILSYTSFTSPTDLEVTMATGTVKWFNSGKGFGFIQPDDHSKDVFVHISAVESSGLATLTENQKISYEVEQGRDGKSSAVNLKAL